MDTLSSIIKRHYRPIGLIVAVLLLFSFIWLARGVLTPFILGFVLAWLLQPTIDWLQERLPLTGRYQRIERVSIILAFYVLSVALLALLVFYVVTGPGKSLATLLVDAPRLIPAGIEALERNLQTFLMSLPPGTREQVSAFLAQTGTKAGDALLEFIRTDIIRIHGSSDMILGFVALPVFLFYLLKDWQGLRDSFYRSLPAWALIHVRSTSSVVRYVTGRYLRGQAILGLAVGVSVFALLSIMRVGYAIPLAAIAGLGEFVPIAGPWLAGIIGILVVLATAPAKAPWIALGYILIQLLQNNLLSPRVQGRQMGIHPAIVIVLTMLAASFLGVLGFVLVLPLTMTTVEVVRYARLRAAASASPIIVPSGHDDVSSSPD